MRSNQQLWVPREAVPDRLFLWRLGPLRLWLGRAEREWSHASEYGESRDLMDVSAVPVDVVPDHLDWRYVAFRAAPRVVELRPRMPRRPVVVRPQREASIPAQEESVYYALIPVELEAVAGQGQTGRSLTTIATEELPSTWFGSPARGLLAYALPDLASRDLAELVPKPHHAVCPVIIRNHSTINLLVQRVLIRTQYMTIYAGHHNLWTNPVRVEYFGQLRPSQIRYEPNPPAEEQRLRKVAEPTEPADQNLSLFALNTIPGEEFDTRGMA